MTPEEIQALAARIAELLANKSWIPGPVRPEPPAGPTPGALPAWAGGAQALSDVAPITGRKTRSGSHRPAYDAVVAASRGAAAGRAPSPLPGGAGATAARGASRDRSVPVAISNRHIHVSALDFERLFGAGKRPTPERPITQPGQFAAVERVRVVGPNGAIDAVRIVGPTRSRTQVELAASDARRLGVDAPVRRSGDLPSSAPVRLEGPAGAVDLAEGAIIAARHIHLSPADASRFGLKDGDLVTLVLGAGDRRSTLHDLLIRAGDAHATEVHLDTDEAQAFGVKTGDTATIVGRPRRGGGRVVHSRKGLVTERDVSALAANGKTLSDAGGYIVTPAAKDRAKALGIWRDG